MDVDMNGNDWQIFYSVHNRQENLWHIYKKTISSNGSNRNRRDVSPTKVCLTTGAVVPFCCKGTLEVSNIYIQTKQAFSLILCLSACLPTVFIGKYYCLKQDHCIVLNLEQLGSFSIRGCHFIHAQHDSLAHGARQILSHRQKATILSLQALFRVANLQM